MPIFNQINLSIQKTKTITLSHKNILHTMLLSYSIHIKVSIEENKETLISISNSAPYSHGYAVIRNSRYMN